MIVPSQTTRGQAWLKNFHDRDRESATLLIDTLRVVGLSALWSGLDTRLQALMDAEELAGPALVFPERSLKQFGILPCV